MKFDVEPQTKNLHTSKQVVYHLEPWISFMSHSGDLSSLVLISPKMTNIVRYNRFCQKG